MFEFLHLFCVFAYIRFGGCGGWLPDQAAWTTESSIKGSIDEVSTLLLPLVNRWWWQALLQRLRDISQHDKNELQHAAKELEKATTELTSAQQRNESLKEELAKAEDTIDELKEQVKVAKCNSVWYLCSIPGCYIVVLSSNCLVRFTG